MQTSSPSPTPRASPLVAFFIYSLECGGAEQVVSILARSLAERGCRVDVLLRVRQGENLASLPPEVRVITLGQGYLKGLFNLARYLRRERPRNLLPLMYPQNELALLAGFIARTGTRVWVSIHSMMRGQDFIVQFRWPILRKIHTPLVKLLARHSYRFARGIIAVSHGAAADIAEVTGLPLSRIPVIYNPVIRPRLFELAAMPLSHPWFAPGSPPVILGVGRFHKIKDFSTLIQAFALVRQTRPARLLMLGYGPDESKLRALAKQLCLEEHVAFPGYAENPYPYMAQASVLASSSLFEALPGVLIEALALGAPVVATDCPSGPREILNGGEFGELVPVGDSRALAQAILGVLAGNRKPAPPPSWLGQFSESETIPHYLRILSEG